VPDPESPEFPNQVVEFNRDTIAARVADTETVLDALTRLAGGADPDDERRHLPRGLGDALDLSRVGMFGHSAGGATTAEAMYADDRVDAGVVVDSGLGYDLVGEVLPPVARHGLDRPVLLLSSEQANPTHVSEPSIASFWANQRGWKRDLQLAGANHVSFADHEALLPQLVATGAVRPAPGQTPQEYLTDRLGSVPPAEAVRSARAYLRAFFDTHLRQRDTGLFDGPSAAHPHVRFVT
jgi:pimeloyl-ACP methyl ester carboxylesterase